jgi:nucleotide-binding universal stress UspA family protein
MPGTIVVGCDASACAQAALDVVLGLARELGDKVVITYAYEPPVRSVGEEWKAHEAALEELGEQVTGPALEEARAAGVEAEVELVPERPVPGLLDVAEKHGARLIAVGTYGESPLRGAILGSVPHKLLQISTTPVLVVPHTEKRETASHGG